MGLQVGVVGRTHQWSGGDVVETHRLAGRPQGVEFFGGVTIAETLRYQ